MRLPTDAEVGAPIDLVVQAPSVLGEDVAALAALTEAEDAVPLRNAACEAYRLSDIRHYDGVAAACAASDYDCALVPQTRELSRVRLVGIDMDSTLITIECVDEIAELHGIGPQVAAITASAMRGEVDFRASLEQRVAMLAGVPAAALERVYAERLALSAGAESMLGRFRAAGAKTLLVSGGFTFFTERLKERLAFDATLANALEVVEGRLTGRLAGEFVDGRAKAARFSELAARWRGADGVTVAIGDGANDLPMLAAADVSIAFRAKPAVRALATHAIDHCGLDAVLNLFA
jgi:phosphoserine phosphatase